MKQISNQSELEQYFPVKLGQCVKNYEGPNDKWKAWKCLFFQCVDKHAPLRSKRVRAMKSPSITPHLKKRMHAHNILKLKAVRSKNVNDWLKFKKCRNAVNNEIKQAKEQYYKNALKGNERDPRKAWQIINELTSRKSHSSSVKEIKLDNNSIRDPCELSSVFNNYFSSIGPTLIKDIHHPTNGPSHIDYIVETEHRFDLKTTNPSKAFTLLSKLCESKAIGLDKISARLLRECADLIASSVCCIFNRSITTGIFPEEWKCSKVISVFKQRERSALNDYRQISIIPVAAKVFERIVYDQF